MILHSGARTRALYAWEDQELYHPWYKRRLTQRTAQRIAEEIWKEEGWDNMHSCPEIVVRRLGEESHCLGRAEIFLNPWHSHLACLIHELTHARGYGQQRVMHTVAFVWAYIKLLSKYTHYDFGYLEFAARTRKLV